MILGIDLGTTYSVGAYLDENGMPQIVSNAEGDDLTPSVVMVDGNEIIVGKVAKRNALRYPQKVCSKIKSYMGIKSHILLESDDVKYTPEMLAQYILKKIVQDASKKLDKEIKDVVVTVPAYFTDPQRKATEDAVKIAGFNLVGMVDEPTAAALYYCHITAMEKGRILVYDFGGGTFDVTLLSIDGKNIRILKKTGDNNAGGTYFDDFLAEYVMDEIFERYEVDLREEKYLNVRQNILQEAEACKQELSSRSKSSIFVSFDAEPKEVVVTRETFNQLIRKMYGKTESAVKVILAEAGLEPYQIDKILMVGGSSQIPYVQERLAELFGKEPSKEVNPNKAVALGAALYGSICASEQKAQHMLFEDVCAHGIGIVLYKENSNAQYNQVLIPANSRIPTKVVQDLGTRLHNQQWIHLTVTEGESEEMDYVIIIHESDIALPEKLPENTKVSVGIALDERQMVHVYLEIPSINFEKEINIQRLSNLTEEEIRMMSGLVADKRVV